MPQCVMVSPERIQIFSFNLREKSTIATPIYVICIEMYTCAVDLKIIIGIYFSRLITRCGYPAYPGSSQMHPGRPDMYP